MSTDDVSLPTSSPDPVRPRRLLRELDRRRDAVANITPNWFASVMGTGIVGTAAATLPMAADGLRVFGEIVWLLASVWLIVLIIATALHWAGYADTARAHHRNPIMAQFYGAPPMALLTIGAGTALYGPDLLGTHTAVLVSSILWIVGTVLGLASAIAVPYLMFTRFDVPADGAFGGWLMPVVPPMVSAAAGALLIPHIPEGQWRETMLLACYAMTGISLVSTFIIVTLMWGRLAQHKVGQAALVPTLWIVLGPLGQAITATGALGAQAHLVFPPPLSTAFEMFGVVLGLPLLGFALLWGCIAAAITVRQARAGLPFALTWWSFTFPVGTCVTGTSALALHTGSVALSALALVLYACLVAAWVLVAVRTFHGAVVRGTLLAPPAPAR